MESFNATQSYPIFVYLKNGLIFESSLLNLQVIKSKNNEMSFKYQAFGVPIVSEIELPALVSTETLDMTNPIKVSVGKVPTTLRKQAIQEKPFTKLNELELLFELPQVASYYVNNGNEVIIEPLCDNWESVLLHFYTNGIAAALFQRNLLPFHVSGIFVAANKVILFAAPSRTGKSTTALQLQQKGYLPFTDDTALLHIIDGKCYATASYPMIRLWQNTFKHQTQFEEEDKQQIHAELEKYGFSFHEQFKTNLVEVIGMVFLQHAGGEIKIEALQPNATMQQLGANIYRKQWIVGMNKQRLQFEHITRIAKVLPTYLATRPKDKETFDTFAAAIETQIIKQLEKQ